MAAAFNSSIMEKLNETIRVLYNRRRKVGPMHLTFDEYLDTFVPYEARDAFRAAAPWSYNSNRAHRWELHLGANEVINATIELRDHYAHKNPPPMVRMPMIQGDAPSEVVDRIKHWAALGGDASREFGRVMKVLELLNMSHSRVAIRYYWPTILALCSECHVNSVKELVTEMQDLRMPARLKPLPQGLSQACRLAAETISTARLIPADIEEDVSGEVVIGIVTGQRYDEPFSEFWGVA